MRSNWSQLAGLAQKIGILYTISYLMNYLLPKNILFAKNISNIYDFSVFRIKSYVTVPKVFIERE